MGELEENCYLIEDEKNCLIVDPGDEFEKIDKEITKRVVGGLITHRHQDHIGALADVLEKYKCQLFDYFSTDEEEYKVRDFHFKVIHMPGHTSDSICFYFYEDGIMFTGDFLFKDSIGRCDLGGNEKDMNRSLDKIRTFDESVKIYPGHGESSTLEQEFNNNIYLL